MARHGIERHAVARCVTRRSQAWPDALCRVAVRRVVADGRAHEGRWSPRPGGLYGSLAAQGLCETRRDIPQSRAGKGGD